jgi:diketogulonate reductase-like aldo/keto reductase
MMSTCCSKHVEASNKYIKKECIKLVITQNRIKMHGQQNIKKLIITLQIQHGTVPIPKSSNKKRLQENIDIFNFELSEQDVAAIDGLNRNTRICTL